MKSIVFAISLILLTTSASANQQSSQVQISDYHKQVIKQNPYQVEVCREVKVSGDKTGDAIMGAIIGGIIGNNVTKDLPDGGTAGAILGGMLGHQNSDAQGGTKVQCRNETRYNETRKTVYSHSTATFQYNGRTYTIRFQK
jgi:uncharacterized protein YcfJ